MAQFSRRQLLEGAALTTLAVVSPHFKAEAKVRGGMPTGFPFNGGLSQIGLNFPYVARDTFLNMAKAGGGEAAWTVANSIITPNLLDSNGYPLSATGSPSRDIQITTQTNRPGRLRMEWAGPCTLSINIAVAGGGNAPTGSLTGSLSTGNFYEFVPSSSTVDILTVTIQASGFTRIDDLNLFYVADTADMAAGLLFTRDFKSKIGNGRIGVVRLMDPLNNNTTNVTTWATRKPLTYQTWGSGGQYRPDLWAGDATPATLITGSTFSWSGGVVTITTPSPHGLTGSFQIAVSKNTPFQYNGVYTGTVTGASTITYPLASNPGANTVAGVFSYKTWDYTSSLTGDPTDKQTNHFTFATTADVIMSNVTVTGAPLDTINWAGHTFTGNECVAFVGNLPTNIERCINYYVIASSVVAGVSFKVATTLGGSTPVTWASAGSSVQCVRPATMKGSGGRAIPIKNSYGDPITDVNSQPNGLIIGRNNIGTMVYEASFDCWLLFGGDNVTFSGGIGNGWPVEVCLTLCKETGMQPWICIPFLATDPKTDYVTSLATLIKSYQDGPCPWMIPRIEPPNELWNFSGGFYATRWSWNKAFVNWPGTHFDQDNEYGKIASTIGQDVAAVLGVKTNGKYKMVVGFQSVLFDSPQTTNTRLASTKYVIDGGLPAYQFANAGCCSTYITPAIIFRGAELPLAYSYNVTNRSNPSGQAADLNTFVNTFNGSSLSGAAATLITIASPGIINWTAHGFTNFDSVAFTTTGALPTGVTALRNYPINVIDADHFNISTSAGGAGINFSGTQSGTHTIKQTTQYNLERANLWYINMMGLLANATYASFGALEGHAYEGGYSPDQVTQNWTSSISSASTAAQCVLSLPTCSNEQNGSIIGTGAAVGMGLTISGRTGSDAAILNTAAAFTCSFTGGASANITGANSLSVGQQVAFTGSSVPPEVVAGVPVYIVSSGNPFQVSATKGGAAITFASASASQTATPCHRVTNVSGNNVTIDTDTSGVSPGSSGTVTYFNGKTWDNTMRLAGRFATNLEGITTTNYTNYTNAGCKFPSQYQFLGGSVWSTRDDLYSSISTAWNGIRTFNGAP